MVHITTNNISELKIGTGPVLILDVPAIQANWIEFWLEEPEGIIHEHGKFLLPEIWMTVLDFVLQHKETVAVIPEAMSYDGKSWKVLKCDETKVGPFGDRLRDTHNVSQLEEFLRDPSTPSQTRVPFKLGPLENARKFLVLIPSKDYTLIDRARTSGLMADVGVPECIAYLWGQICWVCDGERNICPGCTGVVAHLFDAFMGCGVALACPLCLGYEFCQEDKAYCQEYYWELEAAPDQESKARLAKIEQRLKRLSYPFRAEEWQ